MFAQGKMSQPLGRGYTGGMSRLDQNGSWQLHAVSREHGRRNHSSTRPNNQPSWSSSISMVTSTDSHIIHSFTTLTPHGHLNLAGQKLHFMQQAPSLNRAQSRMTLKIVFAHQSSDSSHQSSESDSSRLSSKQFTREGAKVYRWTKLTNVNSILMI